VRLTSIAHLYRVRLRSRVVLVQELLALAGIAVGVALLFASQVASASLNGSVRQLTRGVVGNARYQLDARDEHGFPAGLLGEVQRLPGVRVVVPILEEHAGLIGPGGQQSVDFIGVDPRFARISGRLLRHFSAAQLAGQRALALPAPVVRALGAEVLQPVGLQVGASVKPVLIATELNERDIGSLVHSPVAIAPLTYAQRLTGMQGRLSRIFVQVAPGREREVHAGLVRLAAGHINVEPADFEATLFSAAATPVNQSTQTFAAICALVGFMFAYCSMLLTAHLRRGLVRDLRLNGATRLDILKALLFDALVLGVLASLLGLGLGEVLSLTLFHANVGYLALGFPIGSQRIVTWQSIAIAFLGGVLAACVGVLLPLRDLWLPSLSRARGPELSRPPRRRFLRAWTVAVLAGGAACLAVTTVVLIAAPQSAIVGIVTLILALLLLLPLVLDGLVAAFDRLQRPLLLAWGRVAVVELRSAKSRSRSLAIAATGAVAVFGSVTIQGSHTNLQRGLDRLATQLSTSADLWVAPPGAQNLLATTSFPATSAASLARLPGVRAVGEYHANFLDYGNRRVWVLAPPTTAATPLPASQLVQGNAALVNARLRAGGWAVLSQALAAEHHLRIGESFSLPAPVPMRFRLAGLSTNLAWPPGAVMLDSRDYTSAWGSTDPSALNVMLAPGASAAVVAREVRGALGRTSGLQVETGAGREARQQAASRQGLGRLTQISLLVLIAGVLAMASALSALIWQRRRRFARMKVEGYSTSVLWRALLAESALLLASGCSLGALCGIYGQLLLSHALLSVTGFPVIFSLTGVLALLSFLLVTAVAAAIVAVPGYRAARVAAYPWSAA
jgi:putative ABC transport system permease protein